MKFSCLDVNILRVCSTLLPFRYLACSFISVVVDMVRLGNEKEHCNSEAELVFLLVQDLVVFIRRSMQHSTLCMFCFSSRWIFMHVTDLLVALQCLKKRPI